MLSKKLSLIVACQEKDYGIGLNGKLPWKAPSDLHNFKKITTQTSNLLLKNAVIMGRKTFQDIGRELPNRINYVLSSNVVDNDAYYSYSNFKDAFLHASTNENVETIFVIGGAEIYNHVLTNWSDYIECIYITIVNTDIKCDTFLDENLINTLFYKNYPINKAIDNGIEMSFYKLEKRNIGEDEYLKLCQKIITTGSIRHNRTGIDTTSIFGERMEFDISKCIPFLTTKKLAWKTVLRELLWFISGNTDNKTLQDKKVGIWNGNSTREYLDSIGLTERAEGDLGPIYGFQWRHFGADYSDCHTDYTGKGVDQLQNVIDLIRNDPDSRRIILSAWNPKAQPEMALPPCHILAQWYVRDNKYLDCQMYQRSCDVALGVPFNIASYSLLTYMLAHVCNLQPGKYVQILGDAHIYNNHIEAIKQQLERQPYSFPQLKFSRKIENIDDFIESDFILENYNCHDLIKMNMVV